MDFQKEFGLAFNDHFEVYDCTDNMLRPRSVPCIAKAEDSMITMIKNGHDRSDNLADECF